IRRDYCRNAPQWAGSI
ncbi:chorismate synthase, partial [Chlamydia psittaci 84-8471/1]